MLQFWQDMKSAQFVDYQTRILSFTLPVRANHVQVKNRLTMMLQLTSTGGVLPSFELQSRVDTVDYEYVFTVLFLNLSLVIMFVVNELIEAYDDGFVEYFTKFCRCHLNPWWTVHAGLYYLPCTYHTTLTLNTACGT